MRTPNVLEELVEALKCLPGVGPRSAERMAYYLLQRDRAGAERLGYALNLALSTLGNCQRCNNYAENDVCDLCLDTRRDASTLCVVEMPVDLNRIEQTQSCQGLYYVLLGRLSPLDGVGPQDVALDRLLTRAQDGLVKEVILATSYTAEGEATAYFLAETLKARGLRVSRIARGLPMGGELEHIDSGTLAQAIFERREI